MYLMSSIFDPLKPIWEFLLVPKGKVRILLENMKNHSEPFEKEPYPWTPFVLSVFTPFFMDFLVGPSKVRSTCCFLLPEFLSVRSSLMFGPM